MTIKEFEIRGKIFKYDDDLSWKKWKRIASDEMNEFEKVYWIADNILIFDEDYKYVEVMEAADFLADKLKIRRDQMKSYLKLIGKMFRGIGTPELNHKAIEYQILREMKGAITVSDLESMDFLDVIFYRRMLSLEFQAREDAIKKQELEMKAQAQKNRWRR